MFVLETLVLFRDVHHRLIFCGECGGGDDFDICSGFPLFWIFNKALKTHDPNYVNTLFTYKYQLARKTPLKIGMKISQLRSILDAVADAQGNRHLDLQHGVAGSRVLDLKRVRCFGFVKHDGVKYFEVEDADKEQTTHVQHFVSKCVVSVEDLGLAKITATMQIQKNHSDFEAFLHNGKRNMGEFYNEFSDDLFFKNRDAKISARLSFDWMDILGDKVEEKKKELKAALDEKATEFADAEEKAMEYGAAPAKKSRRQVM